MTAAARHGGGVVDGDTLVAVIAGEETTVRLLNIDTPETKHPDLPVQCLGPEATEFLAERLPAGTEIELEYDEERLDRYDRTLAGVYESGSLVNAEIAAEGLGVPVYFEPNDRFLPEVEEAATAEAEGLGLFSAAIECTVPAQIKQLGAAADQIPAAVDGDPADALAEATALVEDAESLVESLEAEMLGTGTNAVLALPLAVTFADGQREAAEEVRGRAGGPRPAPGAQGRLGRGAGAAARGGAPRARAAGAGGGERFERGARTRRRSSRSARSVRAGGASGGCPAATDQGGSEWSMVEFELRVRSPEKEFRRTGGGSVSRPGGSGGEKSGSGGGSPGRAADWSQLRALWPGDLLLGRRRLHGQALRHARGKTFRKCR